jgi:hypothetical protein
MPSDLKVYLGSAQQAPNGEAFELFKLQPDDTYAKVVYAVVDKAVPIPVVFDPSTPLTVTLGEPMYSVATPTQDGLFASTDRVDFENLKSTYKINAASEPTVDKNFFVNMPSMAPTDHANAYVTGGDKTLRLTAYPSTHGSRGSQVWVNSVSPDTRLVFGVNNTYAGGFSPSGTSFNVGMPDDVGDEGSRIAVYNDKTTGQRNSLTRVISREGGAYVILTGKVTQQIKFTDMNYADRGTIAFVDSTTGDRKIYQSVGNAYTEINEAGVQRVGNGSYASEQGWRSLNGLHFQYNPTTGIPANPWVRIGNMPAVGEGLMLLDVFTATDVNYPSFNVAQVCIKRFQDSFSMSAELTCTNQDAVAIYVGFNFNGDIFLKSTAVWGSVASYQIKFLNTSFTPQTPEVFTGTVTHEIGTPAGFPKSKRVTS